MLCVFIHSPLLSSNHHVTHGQVPPLHQPFPLPYFSDATPPQPAQRLAYLLLHNDATLTDAPSTYTTPPRLPTPLQRRHSNRRLPNLHNASSTHTTNNDASPTDTTPRHPTHHHPHHGLCNDASPTVASLSDASSSHTTPRTPTYHLPPYYYRHDTVSCRRFRYHCNGCPTTSSFAAPSALPAPHQ